MKGTGRERREAGRAKGEAGEEDYLIDPCSGISSEGAEGRAGSVTRA